MKLLALETSTVACSVALLHAGKTLERHEERAREHTRLLMPMIRSVLEEAGCQLADLDAIVLGNGPGSFVGMRIAASVAQGLAFGANLPIVPVSSLAGVAAAALALRPTKKIAVTQDAHMNQVYLGLFAKGTDGLPRALLEECLHSAASIDALGLGVESTGPQPEWIGVGQGWQRYPALAAAQGDRIEILPGVRYPHARDLLALGARDLSGGRGRQPTDIDLAYLRQKVAEVPKSL